MSWAEMRSLSFMDRLRFAGLMIVSVVVLYWLGAFTLPIWIVRTLFSLFSSVPAS
jgi:hypothetical protein